MEEINGFKVIGERWVNEKNCHKCKALCKVCNKEFVTNYHALKKMKSCGCARPKQLKLLNEYINGFKTIQCYGYDAVRGVRWATVECKVCKRFYECDPNKLRYRKHCGCMQGDAVACRYAKSHPQLAQAIKHMKARCYNKKNKDYYNYGGRGITICKEWLDDRNTFCEWALKNGFENNMSLSIDRIDSSKGYSPDNCRWANSKIQARNTRRNVLTLELAKEIRGEPKNMTYLEIAEKYKVSYGTILNVVNNRSWTQ